MSDNDEIQLAFKVVTDLNQSIEILRSSATSVARILTGIDNIVADQPKKTILLAGLAKLNVDLAQLNTLRATISSMAGNIHSTIPELTTY